MDREPVDLFSTCFGCGKPFQSGDRRLRFDLEEWASNEGLPSTSALAGSVEIGLCDDCTEDGDFKQPEIVK